MKSIVFGLICCFVLFGATVQGQGMLVNLGMEAEPVIIQVYSNTPGVLDCGGEIKGFGFKDCKEILAAFSSNERWIMQVQGRKLLVGKLPIGSKMASGMFLIPAHLAGSFVKCKCQSLDIYSIQGLDCDLGCKELNQDTSVQAANGAGTRSAIPSTRNKPGLRSDAPPTPEKEHAGSTGQQTGGVENDTTIQAGGGAGTRSAIPSTRNKPGLRSETPPTPGKEQSTSAQGQTSGLEKGITNQSNQNKPKAEVKTLGDLVSYRTEGNSPKDTVVQKGGGAGTRSAIPSTRNKPGLRSDAPPTPGKEQSTSVQGQTSGLEKGITNQSNQNNPKAEVKTLGDLVSYRTEGDSSKDTKQSKPSLIGIDQEGIRTSTSNSKQNNPKPKQETTTLGEISALAALRTSTNTSTEAYLVSQANQRDANFDESFKALISASNQKVRIPNYQVKSNDPAFYTTNLWSRLRQGNDTCFVASKLTAKELVQTGLIYVHVQFLSPSGLAVNEVCIPVKLPAVAALQPASSILGLAYDVQKAVLNSDELRGQPITTKLYVSEFPKPYSLIMPYFTEEVGLFMLSTESGMVLSFTEVPIEESLQELLLNGFKQSLTIKK